MRCGSWSGTERQGPASTVGCLNSSTSCPSKSTMSFRLSITAQLRRTTWRSPATTTTPTRGLTSPGIDLVTGQLTRLFNPRQDDWNEHFSWLGPELVGRTAVGRTTIDVLNINLPERVEQRRLLIR